MNKMHGIALAGAAAMLLAGCGGGDDAPAPAPAPGVVTTDVPASAQTDAAGLAAYASQQAGMANDTAEPILVGDAVLPLDDSTETSL